MTESQRQNPRVPSSPRLRVAIFGGSGYGGSELLRILLFHPNAEIVLVTANEHAGKPVGEVHKNLNGLTELYFDKVPDDVSTLTDIELAFFALPHGQALSHIPSLPKNVKVIDLSGDFRIDDADIFKQFYKLDHAGDEVFTHATGTGGFSASTASVGLSPFNG